MLLFSIFMLFNKVSIACIAKQFVSLHCLATVSGSKNSPADLVPHVRFQQVK